jgi:hypothetical protein
MRILALAIVLAGGAATAAAAPQDSWLGSPPSAEAAEAEPRKEPGEPPGPEPVAEPEDAPTLAARRVLDVMRRWPGPQMIVGRRMELVWVAHDLEQKGRPRAAGIVRRFLRRYERTHCDRRSPEQEAASAQLDAERVGALREHLDEWHRYAFDRRGGRPEGSTELGIFRGVPICRYR